MTDVFISYSRRDKDRVGKIRSGLESAQVDTWWDGDLAAGAEFSSDIDSQIAKTKYVLVAWSKPAAQSIFVKGEALRALDEGKLVQVMLDASKLPVPLNALNALDLREWNGDFADANFVRVIETVKSGERAGAGVDGAKALATGVSPLQMAALWLAPVLILLPVGAGMLEAFEKLPRDTFLWTAVGSLGALALLLAALIPTILAAFRGR
jgi:hypothetical protein